MYTIQLKRKKLPTPTLGGLSLYFKRGTQPTKKQQRKRPPSSRGNWEVPPNQVLSLLAFLQYVYMYIRRTGPCPSLLLLPFPSTRHWNLSSRRKFDPTESKEKNHVVAVASLRSRGRVDVQVGKNSNHGASRNKKRKSLPTWTEGKRKRNPKKRKKEKKKTTTTLINLDRNHHLVFAAADNSTSGPDDLAHCLCYKATSDGKIIPEDGATGSLCQQLHDGIPEQNFAGDPLYEIYVSHPGTEMEEVHVCLIFDFSFCVLLFAFCWRLLNDTYLTIIVSTPEYHVGWFEEFVQRWMQAI